MNECVDTAIKILDAGDDLPPELVAELQQWLAMQKIADQVDYNKTYPETIDGLRQKKA